MGREALRARLVHGAGDVFYRDGIAATSTTSLSRELGISKRTMYEMFATKDELAVAALAARDLPLRDAFTAAADAAGPDAIDRLVGLFAGLQAFVAAPGFRGCPFLNAAAEYPDPGHVAHAVCTDHKQALRRWIEAVARSAGLRSPTALSHQLLLLFDGALSQVDRPPPGVLPAAARALIESARGAAANGFTTRA